ncbi:MAG: MFS transporter [Chloroflexi bacterium]|nr:MFS transporter [Chloroflexota bacterium]MBI3733482.1 MFS transporter [Chloroflexota bacterium]
MTTLQQAMLSFYWFAVGVHWSAILIVLAPTQVLQMVGDARKGETLGNVVLFGAFISMVVAPVFGAWSDRVKTRWGRRRPFVVVGTLLNVVALLGLAYIPRDNDPSTLPLYIVVFAAVNLFNNLATAPFSALIPDVVPEDQRGAASGWFGLMNVLGNFVGGLTGILLGVIGGVAGAYWLIIVVMLVAMVVTMVSVHEPPSPAVPPFRWGEFLRGLYRPLVEAHNFRWVFLTRFLVTLGIFTVQEFLLFFMKDVIKDFRFFGITLASDPQGAVTFFVVALLFGAIAASLVSGILSDRYGRKRMVYLSGALQGLVAAVFIFYGNYTLALLMGIIFGLGYGAYQSVDWALASDVLPSADDYAKDMGVWHIAFTLPQVIATPIAGRLLDAFQPIGQQNGLPTLGYSVIFALAVVYFMLGTYFVHRIKGVR